jgi:hypothetical protein
MCFFLVPKKIWPPFLTKNLDDRPNFWFALGRLKCAQEELILLREAKDEFESVGAEGGGFYGFEE